MMSGPALSAAPNHGPPPSYDSVVANDELYARSLAYRKYSQQDLEEADELMDDEFRGSSRMRSGSCQPLSIPLHLNGTTSSHLNPPTTSAAPTQHYCPYMYVNPHLPHVMGGHHHNHHSHRQHHLRIQPPNHHHLDHTAQNNQSTISHPQDGLCMSLDQGHVSEDITAPIHHRRPSSSNEHQLPRGDNDYDMGTTTRLDETESDRPAASKAGQSSSPVDEAERTSPLAAVSPLSTVGQKQSEADRDGVDIKNNNINNGNSPPSAETPTVPAISAAVSSEQILSPKQMVIFGRQQRQRSCPEQQQQHHNYSAEEAPQTIQLMTMTPTSSPSCDCQDVLISTPPSALAAMTSARRQTLLAPLLCQCQQMAQMSCANALCHCTDESFRSGTTPVCDDERHFIHVNGVAGGGRRAPPRRQAESEGNYEWSYIVEDHHQSNNDNSNLRDANGQHRQEGLSDCPEADCYFADNGNGRCCTTPTTTDDMANNNSIRISSANRCEIINEQNNDLAIASTSRTAASSQPPSSSSSSSLSVAVVTPTPPPAVSFSSVAFSNHHPDPNNNNIIQRTFTGEGEGTADMEDSLGMTPPRPPIRTTSRYSGSSHHISRPMPVDQESASDLNNNSSSITTATEDTNNNCPTSGRYSDPLLYENGVIRLDMSKIIDQTGLPTYEAALRLESSGYV